MASWMVQIVHEIFEKQWLNKDHREIISQSVCLSACMIPFQSEARCKPVSSYSHWLLLFTHAALSASQQVNCYILIHDSGISLCASFSPLYFPIFPCFLSFHKPPRTGKCELQCKHIQGREKVLSQAMPNCISTNTICIRPS